MSTTANKQLQYIILASLWFLSCSSVENQRHQFISSSAKLPWDEAPVFPVSAAWFKDRFTEQEWNSTLNEFHSIGGDTVLLRAPSLLLRSADEIKKDSNYLWCGNGSNGSGYPTVHCVTEAQEDLSKLGLNIASFATFDYEENYSDDIMICPYEKKINGSRVYFRLVLPIAPIGSEKERPASCDLPAGTPVLVVFTSFAGVDPHRILLESAVTKNITVYLGLPSSKQGATESIPDNLMPGYMEFVYRYINNHRLRFNTTAIPINQDTTLHFQDHTVGVTTNTTKRLMYDSIAGYFQADDACLADINPKCPYLTNLQSLAQKVHMFGKKLVVSPHVVLNRAMANHTVEDHVRGYQALVESGAVDTVAVQDGRGMARSAYFFVDSQNDTTIHSADLALWHILHFQNPNISSNVTFGQQFAGSVQELFLALAAHSDKIRVRTAVPELWLNLGGVEEIPGDPCLPLDLGLSGRGTLGARVSRAILEQGVASGGVHIQRISSFAWDPDYTCRTSRHPSPLYREILADGARPVIANCSWHSPQNMSIVLIGYNLDGLTQGFEIHYHTDDGKLHIETQHGYYFEIDYGIQHGVVSTLMYTQLYDLYNIYHIKPSGRIYVKAGGSSHPCIFTY